ncbi:hypothetical protein Bdiaspc4_35585 [Bradyrhizobium diazoefficiens]|nr:hypothetical protein Bdiaspc4_35585 [Bradyrhizobium diazoefficiens]
MMTMSGRSERERAALTLRLTARLGFRYRHRSGDFDSSGSCGSHAVLLTQGDEVRHWFSQDTSGFNGQARAQLRRDPNMPTGRPSSIACRSRTAFRRPWSGRP